MTKQKITDGIKDGIFEIRKKKVGSDRKSLKSKCWDHLYEVYKIDANEDTVSPFPNFYYCKDCTIVVHSIYRNGNTNKLIRHECVKKTMRAMSIKDKEKIKFAAAKWIAGDLRPYNLVESVNFKNFCQEIFDCGQKNPNFDAENFTSVLPSRNTVKNAVKELSTKVRETIMSDIVQAKQFQAVSIVLDGWSDDQKHLSYLGVIAVLAFIDKNNKIVCKKYTLSVNEMPELVKTKKVVANHFYTVLDTYGMKKEEVKANVTAIHDRGGNIRYGIKDEGITQVLCYAHLINNLLGAMIKGDLAKKNIAAASSLTSYLKRTGLSNKLESTAKLNCPTRWNTVHNMIHSITVNYENIVNVLTEKENAITENRSRSLRAGIDSQVDPAEGHNKQPLEYLSNININVLADMEKVLVFFKDITANLEGESFILITLKI